MDSMKAEEAADELIWRAHHEEGMTFLEMAEHMEHLGFTWTLEALSRAVADHEEQTSVYVELNRELDRFKWPES